MELWKSGGQGLVRGHRPWWEVGCCVPAAFLHVHVTLLPVCQEEAPGTKVEMEPSETVGPNPSPPQLLSQGRATAL